MSSATRRTRSLPAGIAGPVRAPGDGDIELVRRSMLPFLEEASTLGSLVGVEISGNRFVLVADPSLIRQVLSQSFDDVVVGPLSGSLDPVFGSSLPGNYSPTWKSRRLLVSRPLSPRHIQSFAGLIAEHAQDHVGRWQPGEQIVLHTEVQEMTLGMIAACLFSVDITAALDRIRALMAVEQATYESNFGTGEAGSDAMERALREMDEVVFGIIERRRSGARGHGDLLDLMLDARDDDGNALDDTALRDEIVALVLAGHETSALSITLTVAMLHLNPEWRYRVVGQIDEILGERSPTFEDLAHLPLVRQALEETLRLYPPAYMQDRLVVRDIELGGTTLPAGTAMLLPAWVVHRNPVLFDVPLRWDPSRFEPDARRAIPRGTYLPFGSGPKVCPGSHFALLEGTITLTTILQRVELETAFEGAPDVVARAILHLPDGIPMQVVGCRQPALS